MGFLKSVFYYLQGNIRFWRLESKWFPLPKHILEQFEMRKKLALKECVTQGECVVCECKTPELFLADKACSGRCYGSMLNKEKWEKLKDKKNNGK